jgi:hypothetical protein
VSYLRYRDRNGPDASAQADRILVAQPGILEGAGAFDSVARNTVVAAAELGSHVEFWALDRRSNCLEDHAGIQAAVADGDYRTAVGYYYEDATVDGHQFAGFLANNQITWLQHIGLEQTLRDEYDLLVAELPDPRFRASSVLCGGHSLGGVLTGLFAVHDFDGQAGHSQCAGYFALDTTITTSMDDLNGATDDSESATFPVGVPRASYALTQFLLRIGMVPRTASLPVLVNAEMMNLLAIAAVGALTDPNGDSALVQSLPSTANIDITTRALLSRTLLNFLSGSPKISDFRFTNQVALGALLDDNSQPLGFLQASVGFFDGGPIAEKDFPVPSTLKNIPGLGEANPMMGTRPLAIPEEPNGPRYTWRNADRIGAPDDPVYRTEDGTPFTTRQEEVTDITELARSMAEQPLDFTERYFPTKIATDIYQASSPQLARYATHPEGITAHPTLTVFAGGGLLANNTAANDKYHPVIASGYQHLDVLTAAPTQNGGSPEIVSTSLARFATSL